MNAKYEGDTLGLSECCHLWYRVATEHGGSNSCGLTNLQIPVDNPINMAVMDTLEDLLYAVTTGQKKNEQVKECDGTKRKKERKKSKKERGKKEEGRKEKMKEIN